jgi:hypothetical protein
MVVFAISLTAGFVFLVAMWWAMGVMEGRLRCSSCSRRAIGRYTWPGRARAQACPEHVAELLGELEHEGLTPAAVRLEWLDASAAGVDDASPHEVLGDASRESEPWDMRAQAAQSRASRLLGGGGGP